MELRDFWPAAAQHSKPPVTTRQLEHLTRHMQLRRDMLAQYDCIIGPAIPRSRELIPHLLGLLDHPTLSRDAADHLQRIDPTTLRLWCAEDALWSRGCGTNPICEPADYSTSKHRAYLTCRQATAEFPVVRGP